MDAAGANPIARAEMEKTWKGASDPLALASGKELLGRIRDDIQNRCGVSFGNARIIEAMESADVHQDLKDLFSAASKELV